MVHSSLHNCYIGISISGYEFSYEFKDMNLSILLSLRSIVVAVEAGFISSVYYPPAISRGVPDPVPQDHQPRCIFTLQTQNNHHLIWDLSYQYIKTELAM